VVTNVVGLVQNTLVERSFSGAADLARALTVMQIGLDLLGMAPPLDGADLDRRRLVLALVAANEQVQASAAALVLIETNGADSRA